MVGAAEGADRGGESAERRDERPAPKRPCPTPGRRPYRLLLVVTLTVMALMKFALRLLCETTIRQPVIDFIVMDYHEVSQSRQILGQNDPGVNWSFDLYLEYSCCIRCMWRF